MKINFEIIDHKRQRYDTVGDYWQDGHGTWQIRVSKMADPRYEQLVFLHELTELTLWLQTKLGHIDDIDAWDKAYEEARSTGKHARCGCRLRDEPGDDPHAPYHLQHKAAIVAEKAAAKAMGIDWKKYNDEVEVL